MPAGIHRFPQTEVKGRLLLVRQEPWPQTASLPCLSMECFDKLGISQGHSSILHSCRQGRVFLFYTSSSTITEFLKRPKLWEDVVRCCMYLLWLYVPQAAADMVGSEHGRGDTVCLPVQLATEAFQSWSVQGSMCTSLRHILVARLLSRVCSTKEKLGVCVVTKLLSLFSFRYIKTITRGNYGRNDPTTQFSMLSFPRGLFYWLFLHAHTQWALGNRK